MSFWGSVTKAFHQTNRDAAHIVGAKAGGIGTGLYKAVKIARNSEAMDAAVLEGGAVRYAAGAAIAAAPEVVVGAAVGAAGAYAWDFAKHLGSNMGWWK